MSTSGKEQSRKMESGVVETIINTSGSTADAESTSMIVQVISGSTQHKSQTISIEVK
jgi:hypothetical protein